MTRPGLRGIPRTARPTWAAITASPRPGLPDFLFPFQRALVEWAIRKGRAATV